MGGLGGGGGGGGGGAKRNISSKIVNYSYLTTHLDSE